METGLLQRDIGEQVCPHILLLEAIGLRKLRARVLGIERDLSPIWIRPVVTCVESPHGDAEGRTSDDLRRADDLNLVRFVSDYGDEGGVVYRLEEARAKGVHEDLEQVLRLPGRLQADAGAALTHIAEGDHHPVPLIE